MDSDNLFQGLNMFVSGVKDLQSSRSIMAANEQVNQIKNSELDDYQKMNQLRTVGQSLAFKLASLGTPASTIATLNDTLPQTPKTSLEAYMAGGNYKQAAQDLNTDTVDKQYVIQQQLAQTALERERLHDDTLLKVAGMKGDQATSKAGDSSLDKLSKDFQSSESIRTVPGQIAQTNVRLQAVDNALNSYPKNEIPTPVLSEAALGIARALKNGVVNEQDVKAFVPENLRTNKAAAAAYLESSPAVSDQTGFVNLYKNILEREHSLSNQQLEDEAFKIANRNKGAYMANPDLASNTIASQLQTIGFKDVKPSDIILNKDKQISWSQREKKNNDSEALVSYAQKAKAALKSSDPATAAKAQAYFQHYGLDASAPMDDLKRQIDFNVRSGKYDADN